ncbi:hypothetical protein V6N13_057056 [Hibiscus sabdariffa]|uniref:Uncharacterized protein n=1 Tax=Hibiscus sabdariffa TaxID=183260 RepID=A0ABR2D2S4_9ROSI
MITCNERERGRPMCTEAELVKHVCHAGPRGQLWMTAERGTFSECLNLLIIHGPAWSTLIGLMTYNVIVNEEREKAISVEWGPSASNETHGIWREEDLTVEISYNIFGRDKSYYIVTQGKLKSSANREVC